MDGLVPSKLVVSIVSDWCHAEFKRYDDTVADLTEKQLHDVAEILRQVATHLDYTRENRTQDVDQVR